MCVEMITQPTFLLLLSQKSTLLILGILGILGILNFSSWRWNVLPESFDLQDRIKELSYVKH